VGKAASPYRPLEQMPELEAASSPPLTNDFYTAPDIRLRNGKFYADFISLRLPIESELYK
jgi:hypothetical protein